MSEKTNLSRRELIKIIAASGCGFIATAFLPGKWVRPEIAAGVLPAHAQSTLPLCTVGDQTSITVTTTTQANGEYVDFDLYVRTPDGQVVGPLNPGPWQGAAHNGDNIDQTPPAASESASISGPSSGTYQIGVRYFWDPALGPAPNLSITVTIVSGDCVISFQRTIVDDSATDPMHIADIVYPAGTVVEQSGPFADRRSRASKHD